MTIVLLSWLLWASLTFKVVKDLVDSGDGVGMGLLVFLIGPSLALEPKYVAAEAFGGLNVLAQAISDDKNLFWFHFQGVNAESEQSGVRLADTDNCTLDDALE